MIDINAIDRINFAISEDSLNYRRFEILIDKSINNLIDTYVANENILGRDNERKKKIVRKMDHLDSEIGLLETYKPKAEEYIENINQTVVNNEHTSEISNKAGSGWTPVYSKDFRPMCMVKSRSLGVIPSLPMSEKGVKKSNVHDM